MSDDRPKSAFDLAMERLRQKDKEASIDDRPLTDEQKAAIAEARQFYKAKVAEREILHQAALRAAGTHEEIERQNEELRRDQERLANDRDHKIAEIRRGKPHGAGNARPRRPEHDRALHSGDGRAPCRCRHEAGDLPGPAPAYRARFCATA
jgi:hypothetical protein